jgi:hypothetical protein
MTGKAKWKLIAKVKGDHRVFENMNASSAATKYSIADWSGSWPEGTDDGILWLVPMGNAEVYISSTKKICVNYAVRAARDDKSYRTASGLHVLPMLKELYYTFTFERVIGDAITAMLTVGVMPVELRTALDDAAYAQSMREFVAR